MKRQAMVFSRLVMRLAVVLLLSAAVAGQESLLQRLLRIAGLTAAPSQLRGPGEAVEPGNIWIVPTDRGTPK